MRTLPKPWIPPNPREVYVVYTGPTSYTLKERKYQKCPDDTLIPVATLSARGPVTWESRVTKKIKRRRKEVKNHGKRKLW